MKSLLGTWWLLVYVPLLGSHAQEEVDTKVLEQARLVSLKSSQTITRMLEVFPPSLDGASPYGSATLTQQCQRDLLSTSTAMEQSHEWAWYAIDAAGQVGPDVFTGNLQFVGNYDECKRVKAAGETYSIEVGGETVQHKHTSDGMYCRVYWKVDVWEFASYGDCVPDSCTTWDLRNIFTLGNDSLPVHTVYCEEPKDFFSDASAIAGLVITVFFVLLVLVASLVDLIRNRRKNPDRVTSPEPHGMPLKSISPDQPHTTRTADPDTEAVVDPEAGIAGNVGNGVMTEGETTGTEAETGTGTGTEQAANEQRPSDSTGPCLGVLLSWSLVRNVPAVLSTSSPGAYTCMGGLRILAMWWVLYGHSYQLGKYLLSNPHLQMLENRDSYVGFPFIELINRNGRGVEVFFLLSGCLVTISFLKALERNDGRQSLRQMIMYYVHRYIRLTPVLMFLVMLYACFFPYLGSGPTPPEYMGYNNCRKNWWVNLLYLQNIIGTSHQCMGWTWYVANDWAYYCVAPFFIYMLYRFPKCGRALLVVTWFLYVSVRANVAIYIGIDYVSLYIPPWTRMGPYLMGIALGYTMHCTKCDVKKIHPCLKVFLWGLAVVLGGITFFSVPFLELYFGDFFTAAVAIIVFFCCSGYGGFVNAFLSWRGFVPLARLSYAVYLVHPILMYYHMEFRTRPLYMEQESMFFISHGYLLVAYFVAFFLSLVFEIPFLEMERRILPKRK